MNTFVENFKERWSESFDEAHAKTLKGYKNYQPPGILRRVWNDAVLGGVHRDMEFDTPFVVQATRAVGRVVGTLGAIGPLAVSAAGLFVSTAAIPVLPTVGSLMSLSMMATFIGGGIYGLLTKAEDSTKPYERLVHIDRGAGVRTYFMQTVHPEKTPVADKANHIWRSLVDGYSLPVVGAYRAVNTPIRLAGYAMHAFDTAAHAAVRTIFPKGEPAADAKPPVETHDFTM